MIFETNPKTLLITFEGIDGCGKSTQIEMLNNWFSETGRRSVSLREPGGVDISEQIRTLLLHSRQEVSPVTELLLFSAARSQLIFEKVKPLIDQGWIVILDRFYDSTTAYQGYGRESASPETIRLLNNIASLGLIPDITFYLRINYQEALRRTEKVLPDRMEQSGKDFFEKVIRGYDQLSLDNSRIITVDAHPAPDIIHGIIVEKVESLLSVR